LASFDETVATKIYTDPILGMNSVNSLYYWVSAKKGGKGSTHYDIIKTNFQMNGVVLTDDDMTTILSD
jgi:hypothetical protein